VLLIGHNLQSEFKSINNDGIKFSKDLYYSGCVDTYVIVEDTEVPLPGSVTGLMQRYDFAECKWSTPTSNDAKWVFIGAHNAGNDAVASLKVAIAVALDMTINTNGAETEGKLAEDWADQVLQGIETNIVLMAYDTEVVEIPGYKPKVENRTSEHGFAWLRTSAIKSIPPGPNGINWHPYIQATHWINRDFQNFENSRYLVGNRDGFWKQYGQSQHYRGRESPAPFHAFFEDLAKERIVQKVVASPADTGPDSLDPAYFPPPAGAVSAVERKSKLEDAISRDQMPITWKDEASNSDVFNERGATAGDHLPNKGTTSSRGTRPMRGSPWTRGGPWRRGGPSARGTPSTRGTYSSREIPSVTDSSPSKRHPSTSANPATRGSATISASTTTKSTAITTSGNTTTTESTTATHATFSWAQIARGK